MTLEEKYSRQRIAARRLRSYRVEHRLCRDCGAALESDPHRICSSCRQIRARRALRERLARNAPQRYVIRKEKRPPKEEKLNRMMALIDKLVPIV